MCEPKLNTFFWFYLNQYVKIIDSTFIADTIERFRAWEACLYSICLEHTCVLL